jgi:hypothetical protein
MQQNKIWTVKCFLPILLILHGKYIVASFKILNDLAPCTLEYNNYNKILTVCFSLKIEKYPIPLTHDYH